jgi:hypothetical protein
VRWSSSVLIQDNLKYKWFLAIKKTYSNQKEMVKMPARRSLDLTRRS